LGTEFLFNVQIGDIMFHENVPFVDMYFEVYDEYKVNVPCGRDNVVHSMQSSRVTLTYGRRLQNCF